MEIYKTTVKGIGAEAKLFENEKLLILFGENAPDTLKDYCYNIEVLPIEQTIASGMKLQFDHQSFQITAVGDQVQKNLSDLGHISINFNGEKLAELPGTLYVEAKTYPQVSIGTVITISF